MPHIGSHFVEFRQNHYITTILTSQYKTRGLF